MNTSRQLNLFGAHQARNINLVVVVVVFDSVIRISTYARTVPPSLQFWFDRVIIFRIIHFVSCTLLIQTHTTDISVCIFNVLRELFFFLSRLKPIQYIHIHKMSIPRRRKKSCVHTKRPINYDTNFERVSDRSDISKAGKRFRKNKKTKHNTIFIQFDLKLVRNHHF